MARLKELLSPRNPATRRVVIIVGAVVVGLIIFSGAAVQAWEYSNSVSFCANTCHDVHPEESPSNQDFYHARVRCTECHMGRVSILNNVLLKASHFQHIPQVLFGQAGRPLEAETMRPANESCERCHWPPAFHGDTVREITHFKQDEGNSEEVVYLILKTGAGEREEGLGYGIHWHITNRVEYIATDDHKENIPWVRSTLPDGRTVEFSDVTAPLSAEEIAEGEKRVMDCVDCHNRMGHPFPSPEELVDEALADGRLSRDLPFAKKEMLALLSADYTAQEAALAAVGPWEAQYRATYPEAAASQSAAVDQAAQLAGELIPQLVFEEPGITWRSFPDHNRHDEFAGCFRCHDGKHVSSEGESIRLHCNICHSIPLTVEPGEDPPAMPAASLQEPESHLETNFVADHRFLANSICSDCHGDVEFGSDESMFCALSGCHGREWPSVDLDAAFPHPIELEGKHAEVWCHECHDGVRKPEYDCDNCHVAPMEPHFGQACEDCHTPVGFEQADLGDFKHPVALEGTHANLACSDCHTAGQELSYECAGCHQPPSETHFGPNCEECHTPTSFRDATLPPELHPVPLIGSHQRATCDVCHAAGQRVPEYVCSNCHKPPENHLTGGCDTCHNPEGWAKSVSLIVSLASEIPHELDGREDCLRCHDPAEELKPAPSNHTDYVNEQCILCHKAEQ